MSGEIETCQHEKNIYDYQGPLIVSGEIETSTESFCGCCGGVPLIVSGEIETRRRNAGRAQTADL